jgi:Domain of unknown function (DUF5134)
MMTPGWLMDIFAAVMLAIAAISAARLVAARPWHRGAADADIDAAHLLMGISMAGMLAAGLQTLPGGVWEVIFALLAAWFAGRVWREGRGLGARVLADGHHVPHLVHSAAMLYMVAAPAAPMAGGGGPGMSSMGGATGPVMQTLRLPVIALVFALWLSAYAVLDLDRLSGPAHTHGSYFARLAVAPAGGVTAGASAAGGSPAVAAAIASPTGAPGGGVTQMPAGAGDLRPSATLTGNEPAAVRAFLLSPQLAAGCRIAMGVTMAFMLVIMI